MRITKTSRTSLVFIGLILFSFFLRLFFISGCLFHHDSIQLANAVKKTLQTGKLQPTVSGRYGFVLINSLSVLLMRPFIADMDYILNLTTVIFASLTVGLAYIFTKKLTGDEKLAVFTSMLLSVNPLFLSVTVYAKSHAISLFFVFLSGCFLLEYIRTDKLLYKILFSICYIFSLTVRNINIYYIVPFFVLILFCKSSYKKWKIRLRKYSWPLTISFIIWLGLNLSTTLYEAEANGLMQINLGQARLISYFILNYIFQSLNLLGLILLLFSLIYIAKFPNFKPIILFCLLWSIPYLIIISFIPTISARLLLPILYPSLLLIAISLKFIYKKKKMIAIGAFLVLCFLFLIKIIPIVSFRHRYCAPKEFALFVKGITKNNSYIISNDEGAFLGYYADRKAIGYPLYIEKQELTELIKQYYDILKRGDSLYVTGKILFLYDEFNSSFRTLKTNFILEYRGSSLNEEYHHSELGLRIRNESIYQVRLNPNKSLEQFRISYHIPTS